MICLTRGKCQGSVDIRVLKVRIILKDHFARLPRRKHAKNIRHRDAQVADARTAMHPSGVNCDSRQEVIHESNYRSPRGVCRWAKARVRGAHRHSSLTPKRWVSQELNPPHAGVARRLSAPQVVEV